MQPWRWWIICPVKNLKYVHQTLWIFLHVLYSTIWTYLSYCRAWRQNRTDAMSKSEFCNQFLCVKPHYPDATGQKCVGPTGRFMTINLKFAFSRRFQLLNTLSRSLRLRSTEIITVTVIGLYFLGLRRDDFLLRLRSLRWVCSFIFPANWKCWWRYWNWRKWIRAELKDSFGWFQSPRLSM